MKKSPRKKKPDKKVEKKSTQKKKSPPGKFARIPGIDKGKVIIMFDFVEPLPEFGS